MKTVIFTHVHSDHCTNFGNNSILISEVIFFKSNKAKILIC